VALPPHTRLGPYEVVEQIGIGGMGEVYRATDTNLGRQVAIKVLPDAFANDSERLARFDREARTLAALNHPNIAAIYGIEKGAGTTALVMELINGPTLADRITEGPVPLEEALAIGRQIAEALEAAHERGIVHRDLKPANTKLRPDGTVKVLDFGLAKAIDPMVSTMPGASMSPTITTPAMTRAGIILGTAAYMSPEQAKGKSADKRSDIWAFGCVLYEMLTGTRAFDGDGVSDTMAAVLRGEPDWARIPPEVPPPVGALLRRCLEKDSRRRLADISTARFVFEEPALVGPVRERRPAEAPSSGRRLTTVAAVAVAVVAITSTIWWRMTPTATAPPEMRLEISTAPTRDVSMALSPDGQSIVYAATTQKQSRLWLRSLNGTTARMLPGTEGSGDRLPFWSADGRSIGFFADGKLKRIDIDTGSVQSLAGVGTLTGGGTWNANGVILFAPTLAGPLFRISAAGGEAKEVTRMSESDGGHNNPLFLPDGRHFLYTKGGTPGTAGVYIGDLDGTSSRRLDAGRLATYASPNQLLFVRGTVLFAQRFDLSSLQLSGQAVPIADNLAFSASISAATTGTIAYRSGTGNAVARQFLWFDRSGKELGPVGERLSMVTSPSLSPDGRRVAVDSSSPDGNLNVWTLETDRGLRSRLTLHAPPASDFGQVWSPDGNSIAFTSNVKGNYDLYRKSLSGQRAEDVLLSSPQLKVPSDWSSDGRVLLYFVQDPKTGADIMGLPLQGGGVPFEVVRTSFNESGAKFSPDAKWIAYRSDKSGRSEVYVQPFPLGLGMERMISSGGGAQPRWSPDGKELFYVAFDEQLMAVSIARAADGRSVTSSTPVPLFRTQLGGAVQGALEQLYVVSRDGRRFLMATLPEEPVAAPITLILNRTTTKN